LFIVVGRLAIDVNQTLVGRLPKSVTKALRAPVAGSFRGYVGKVGRHLQQAQIDVVDVLLVLD
jgi:hypothetical protein